MPATAAAPTPSTLPTLPVNLSPQDVLADYRLAVLSREASLLGRKEVFMGKAKFGIFGDGKEVAQIAMARAFAPGDWRSGYYRDQTFMFAAGLLTVQQYFAQLYAHTSVEAEPASGGRLMNGHFATRFGDAPQKETKNSSSDISPTAGQMPRLLGLAYASKLYRGIAELQDTDYSDNGNEIAFGTIGNASTSEGLFFEAINAAAVLQAPMLMSVWDDGYGISVPQEYHTATGSISQLLGGIAEDDAHGMDVIRVYGWDYVALISTYAEAAAKCRQTHRPALIHVTEVTQPQGHSTSGSHERYKSPERLAWEAGRDCNARLRAYILEEGLASEDELVALEKEAKAEVLVARSAAWQAYRADIDAEAADLKTALQNAGRATEDELAKLAPAALPGRAEMLRLARRLQLAANADANLASQTKALQEKYRVLFNENLFAGSADETHVPAEYAQDTAEVDGREVLLANFDAIFANDARVFAIGEDVGRIGDVNQGMAGLQAKYGELRVTDTGIREATILGQGIGAALRGLRPIVEIQYLDYLLYALQTMSDDLASLAYRTAGGQHAPLIIRTRGHRLEGMWHSGSPMGMIISAVRGVHVLVPRNLTEAAAFYNTCLQLNDPCLIIEPLNGYRLKERMPSNPGAYTLPLGVPSVLREGTDVTLVTYGSTCRVVEDAATFLATLGVSAEVIDVRTLLPFDTTGIIRTSLQKTSRIVFVDEDVPGGATAYMLRQVLEVQDGYHLLDSAPRTVTAQPHRPAYGTDGDYMSKSNAEDVIEAVLELMAEADPARYGTFAHK